jgi:hypothetical protein
MKRFTSFVFGAAIALLALGPVTSLVHAQSTKKPGVDVQVQPAETWFNRHCAPTTASADVGFERAAAGIMAVTDCGGATSSTTLRGMQAGFYSFGASSVLASATTIAPTNAVHHISGTTAIATITVPAFCSPTCTLYLIPDGLFTTTTAGNISLASTAVVNKALVMVYDGTKFNPSY